MPRKRRIKTWIVICFTLLAIWLILPLFVVQTLRFVDDIPFNYARSIARCAVWISVMNPVVRQSVAQYFAQKSDAFNDKGVLLTNQNEYDTALIAFENALMYSNEAVRADDDYKANANRMADNYAVMMLKHADELFYDDQTSEGKKVLKTALSKFPENALVVTKYADMLNSDDQLTQAEKYYTKALELEGSDVVVGYAMNQALNVKDDLDIETRLKYKYYETSDSLFCIKSPDYEGALQPLDLLRYFEMAKEKLKMDLGLDMKRKLNIRIYQPNDFAIISSAPSWAEAAFDTRLRLNLDRLGEGIKPAEDLIYHEYTHVLIERMLRTKVPVWFQEGIAQLEEPNLKLSDDELMSLRGKATSTTLEGLAENSFADIESRGEAENAYIISKYFVKHILWDGSETTGTVNAKGRLFIEDLRTGLDFSDAFKKNYDDSMQSVYMQWLQQIFGSTNEAEITLDNSQKQTNY